MYPFKYQRASNLAEVVAALADDPEAKMLAGGMTLIPSMKHRLAAPSRLLDISRLPELQGLSRDDASVTVGAASAHAAVASSATVREAIPALAELAGSIGDPQVRARGTIGGSVANADPAADYPAAILGLDATIITDRREIAADAFFVDMFTTALAEAEVIRAVRFRVPRRAAYAKFEHPASGYAMTGVLVADFGDAVRVAVTGAAPTPFRWLEAEAALGGGVDVARVATLAHPAAGLNADMHAPAEYRAHLIGVMTRRAIQQMTRLQ